jgi:hypothetical protein
MEEKEMWDKLKGREGSGSFGDSSISDDEFLKEVQRVRSEMNANR